MNRPTADIYERSYRLSQELFLDDNGDDLFLVDRFPFGKLSQTQLFHVVLETLMAEREGSPKQAPSILSSAGIAEWSKRNCFDWQIKEKLAKFVSSSQTIDTDCDILAIYDVRNGAMIDTLSRVHRVLQLEKNIIGLTFEPRVYNRIRQAVAKSMLYPNGVGEWDRRRVISIFRELFSKYQKHRGELRRRVESVVGNNRNGVLRYLDQLFARFYRQSVKDYVRVCAILEQLKPNLIVAASDCHKFSRMFALLSERYGAQSLVIQHGATISPHGYVPLYADKFAAWGKLSADWMISRDAPDEKIVVTGQPRLDRLIEYFKKLKADRPKASRRILVATNPIPQKHNEALVKIIADGIRAFAFETELTFKLHPGQSQLEFFRRLCYHNQLNCRIEARGDLYRMIAESDIVITTQSTVGIETLALGLDLIIVDFEGLQTAIPYDDYQCVYKVTNADELAESLRRHLTDAEPWPTIRTKRDQFVRDYLYQVDGGATKRVAELALAMSGRR